MSSKKSMTSNVSNEEIAMAENEMKLMKEKNEQAKKARQQTLGNIKNLLTKSRSPKSGAVRVPVYTTSSKTSLISQRQRQKKYSPSGALNNEPLPTEKEHESSSSSQEVKMLEFEKSNQEENLITMVTEHEISIQIATTLIAYISFIIDSFIRKIKFIKSISASNEENIPVKKHKFTIEQLNKELEKAKDAMVKAARAAINDYVLSNDNSIANSIEKKFNSIIDDGLKNIYRIIAEYKFIDKLNPAIYSNFLNLTSVYVKSATTELKDTNFKSIQDIITELNNKIHDVANKVLTETEQKAIGNIIDELKNSVLEATEKHGREKLNEIKKT